MTESPPQVRPRDAERSREAILDAAVGLFSRQGFEATTVGQVAEAAAVARGTPSYFFGSKEGLWKAVLEREGRAALEVAPRAFERLGADREPARLIEALVDAFLEFLEAHPHFLRLVQWSELQGNTLIDEVQSHWDAVARAVATVADLLSSAGGPRDDPAQVVMSIIGLCNAHLVYGQTLATPLGVDARDPAFLEARRAHLKRVLVAALT